jgi:PAS domain S-box-containing protein
MNAKPARSELTAQANPSPAMPAAACLDVRFRGLAQLAANVCQTPLASIAIIGSGCTWCNADGPLPAAIVPPHDPFAKYAFHTIGLFEVRDASHDPRFPDTAYRSDPQAIFFYAAIALRTGKGEVLGAIAVYDHTPRQLTPGQRAALALLAEQAVSQSELRASLAERELILEPRASTATHSANDELALALLESAPVAVYHTDAIGNLIYVNSEYRRTFGLTPEQSVNDWAQGVHPEDRARMEDAWADFCRRPRPVRFEYRTEPIAGAIRFFAEQVVAADGVPGFVGTISDFTELVAARGNLKRVETVFRDTFEQAPIGIAYANRDGRFLRCNQAFCAMLGFAPDELLSTSIGKLTFSEDVAHTSTELERLWSGEIDFVDIEKRYSRKDGSTIWVRVTTALVREGSAIPECSVEFLRDISVRKDMAAALLQNQTLLEAVIAELPAALLACDAVGHITHYNRAAADLLSIPGTAAAGLESAGRQPRAAEVYLADGVTPLSWEDQPLARALRGETITNTELVVAPCDSTPRTTLSSARRLVGPDGQQLGAVAVMQDITERKESDLELERVHKQLVSASRQAGMAEVATNVLHNVGNVLHSVNISASLVAESVKQSKAPGLRRVAALILEQGQDVGSFIASDDRGRRIPAYLATLGEQLLTEQTAALRELASLRDNLEHIKDTVAMQQSYAKLCGVTETVNVVDLVEDSLRLNAGAFARHGVTLQREFNEVPPIIVDKHKVLQILVNLVRNAKYACDESGRRDKLLTVRVENALGRVRVAVIDNGVGIPTENMSRLFNHGFTTRKSGHGFGLHSGALAAQDLGGSLRAESEGPGRGASFILELPYLPPDAARV